jgi:hypothetical protein
MKFHAFLFYIAKLYIMVMASGMKPVIYERLIRNATVLFTVNGKSMTFQHYKL